MSTTQGEDPFFALRPPTSDPATYLTFLEHNLNEENLSSLHEVLKDPELTSSIGWDLVSILLPLVPASETCLHQIATLGNPREVVLKVAEALRSIDFDQEDRATWYTNENENDEAALSSAVQVLDVGDVPVVLSRNGGPSQATEEVDIEDDAVPLANRQFTVLIRMLSVLHPRIKTKFPSRFLSTSLQAVLDSFSRAATGHEELVQELVAFIKVLNGTKRPHLPPRRSTSEVFTRSRATSPVGRDQIQQDQGDKLMQDRLLQSFMTHVIEYYMASLHSEKDIPGMAWTSRLQEKLHPERTVPSRQTYTEMFEETETLHRRSDTWGQIVAMARDLDISSDELRHVVLDLAPELSRGQSEEDGPPSRPEDIPYSKTGSLYLLTAREVASHLYGRQAYTSEISIFPQHATILENFYGPGNADHADSEAEPLLDTTLALGILALQPSDLSPFPGNEDFHIYLQRTSMLSSTSPSPSLREHARNITTRVLHAHPSDLVRFSFVEDTLEHCPLDNLRVEAIQWLKEEITAAIPSSGNAGTTTSTSADVGSPAAQTSLFATPIPLSKLTPFIFGDLRDEQSPSPEDMGAIDTFRSVYPFRSTALNFLYLLLTSKHLHEPLAISSWWQSFQIGEACVRPLERECKSLQTMLASGSGMSDGQLQEARMEVMLLEEVLGRCNEVARSLGLVV